MIPIESLDIKKTFLKLSQSVFKEAIIVQETTRGIMKIHRTFLTNLTHQ